MELLAFNGDTYLGDEFLRLRDNYGIKAAVETGTFKGGTTLWLSRHFETVDTIEINTIYYHEAAENLRSCENVKMHLGSSVNILPIVAKPDSIVFLDAHWLNHNPLLEELDILMSIRPKIIAIHDFKVPSHPEFGYDEYPAQNIIYEWDYIKNHIINYSYFYNSVAVGAKRGCIFLING